MIAIKTRHCAINFWPKVASALWSHWAPALSVMGLSPQLLSFFVAWWLFEVEGWYYWPGSWPYRIDEDTVGLNIVSLVKCVIVLMYHEVLYPLPTFHVLGGIVPSNLENSINSSDVSGSGNRLMIMIMMVMKTTTKMKVKMRTVERVKRCTAWKCNTGGDQPSINWDSLLRSRIAICWIRKPRYIKIAVQVIYISAGIAGDSWHFEIQYNTFWKQVGRGTWLGDTKMMEVGNNGGRRKREKRFGKTKRPAG